MLYPSPGQLRWTWLPTVIIIVGIVVLIWINAPFTQAPTESVSPTPSNVDVFCTQDAKMCPDGSYVGRVGPNCEFAPCPSTASSWRTVNTDELSFSYPVNFGSEYIGAQEWPPTVKKSLAIFLCTEEGSLVIDDRTYCRGNTTNAAAGSRYVTYNYMVIRNNEANSIEINFVLRFPTCQNYDESRRAECQEVQDSLDVDALVDKIVQTVIYK